MKSLIRKELFFATHPCVYLFALLGLMTAIPNYPSMVGLGYAFFAVMVSSNLRRANRDEELTVMLPVRRDHIVAAKAVLLLFIQALQLVFAAAGAVIAYFAFPGGNLIGTDANLAFFGLGALAFGVANLVYLPCFFKTGTKGGLPVLFATLAFIVTYGVLEVAIQAIPTLKAVIDGYSASGLGVRAAVLAVGLVAMLALTALGAKIGVKRFDKVSL